MEQLFSTFDAATDEQWKARIAQDLKGTTFDDLIYTDRNGIRIQPFYTATESPLPTSAAFANPEWDITVSIPVDGNEAEANKSALEALQGGASALRFEMPGTVDLPKLLKGIDLNAIMILFAPAGSLQIFLDHLDDYLAALGMLGDRLNCYVICDPISNISNNAEYEATTISKEWEIFNPCRIGHKAIAVHAAVYHNAGATPVYELACTLAHLNEYLHFLQENHELNRIEKILLTVAVDTHFFEQIAKLRALRILVSLLSETYNLDAAIHLQAVTSDLYRAPVDPYSNLLRDTIAGMAGVLGGCDSLIIHQFDAAIRMPNDFSDRLSRNQQLIFKEESYLQKVADVAHGAYFIETMTRQLAEKAWSSFQAIEQEGGWLQACKKNIPQNTIQKQREAEAAQYKSGAKVLTGINKYQNAEEIKKQVAFRETPANFGFPAWNIARDLLGK